MSCDTCGMANGTCTCADEVDTLRAQLTAVEKERDAVITASIAAMMAMRVNLDAAEEERDALAARLAAAEKERDEAADSYEITLARMAENCAERQGERDALAARVARLEGALEPTVATHAVIAGFLGGAHQMWLATQILTALRARAGMEPR